MKNISWLVLGLVILVSDIGFYCVSISTLNMVVKENTSIRTDIQSIETLVDVFGNDSRVTNKQIKDELVKLNRKVDTIRIGQIGQIGDKPVVEVENKE